MKLNIKLPHVVIVVGSAFAGAAIGYLESLPGNTLLAAFESWKGAEPIILNAIGAGATAVVALLHPSPVVPS